MLVPVWCACVRACVGAIRVVSMDKILRFINTFIIINYYYEMALKITDYLAFDTHSIKKKQLLEGYLARYTHKKGNQRFRAVGLLETKTSATAPASPC